MKKPLVCALILALAGPSAALAAPAASSDAGLATLSVRHSDLNLTTEQGARLMIQRLDAAAADVCGASTFVSLAFKQAVRGAKCYQESMNRALAALGSPAVTALYRARAVTVASN